MKTRTNDPVVGIDLGTTFSVIAVREADGRAVTIPNAEGDLTTPSAVYFHQESIVVGKEAVKAAAFEPELVAEWAKRDMGKPAYRKPICGHQLPPEVIQSLILRKLRADASLKLGAVTRAVITVPAYFNEPRRKSTQDAGRLAGLDVLDIINEPTAAAIAYGMEQGFLDEQGVSRQREVVLVYDLGGGTFDATLMAMDGRRYTALATAGDVYLGGIDWNQRLVQHLAGVFQKETRIDLMNNAEGLQLLRHEAEEAKRALTSRPDALVQLAFDGARTRIRVTREEFEALTEDLLQRTLFTVERLLRDATLTWHDITRVLLVGGSTRMPAVAEQLQQQSGKPIDRSLSPDEAVAHGAAVYADLITRQDGQRPEAEVINVNSHDLSVLAIESSTGRNRRQVMIRRNTALPASGVGRFVTGKDNQGSVVINVVEGGDASGKHATPIGKCVVKHLPTGLPAKTPVDVKFHYAANGRLTVEAWLPTADRSATMSIERTSGLSEPLLRLWQRRIEDHSLVKIHQIPEPPPDRPASRSLLDKLDELDGVTVDDLDVSGREDELVEDEGAALVSSDDDEVEIEIEVEDPDVSDSQTVEPPPKDDTLDDFLKRFR